MKKRILFILMTLFVLLSSTYGQVGNTMGNPIDLGIKSSRFNYVDKKNTREFTDNYQGRPTSDVFYKFTITVPMHINISHCGLKNYPEDVYNTYVSLLDSSGNCIAFNDNPFDEFFCSNPYQSYLRVADLPGGTYYVVSEGYSENGNISTRIWGDTYKVNIMGNTFNNPIVIGNLTPPFNFSDTQDTSEFTCEYETSGFYYNDVFYKFTTTSPIDLVISNCGSDLEETSIALFDSKRNRIDYNTNTYGLNVCPYSWHQHGHLEKKSLRAGTYYIVVEGGADDGRIKTSISGTLPDYIRDLAGNTMEHPIDLDVKSSDFSYYDIKNTREFTDNYHGKPGNDVFYKFTTTVPMHVQISNCNYKESEDDVYDTYLSLLDSSGNCIAFNDDPLSYCYQPQQSKLRMADLPAGTYYVVSEGKSENGNIMTRIWSSTYAVNKVGNTFNNPIFTGDFSPPFYYSDTQNTSQFTGDYDDGLLFDYHDVFYKFTTSSPIDLVISHCGSNLDETVIILLDSRGNRIDYNIGTYDFNICPYDGNFHAHLEKRNLSAGTYYVVVEGYIDDGEITTSISGTPSTGQGGNEDEDDDLEDESDEYTHQPLEHNPYGPIPINNLTHTQNYILSVIPLLETSTINGLNSGNSIQQIQYFDGLGRPTENIQRGFAPDKQDLVTYQEYDQYGRESNLWLPAHLNANGSFVNLSIVAIGSRSVHSDSNPYSKMVYENSPLNRPIQYYGPGEDWHNKSKAVKTAYLTNNTELACKYYTCTGSGLSMNLSCSGNYADHQLYVNKLTNEDDNISYEFKNKLGQLVLSRQMDGTIPHDSYYIYDNYGNLQIVLPPLVSDSLNSGNWPVSDTYLQKYAYLYQYDDRNRCIAKKLPGAEWQYYIYDKADRLIFTQNGEQRVNDEWLFSISDDLNRIVLTGICKNNLDYENNSIKDVVVKAKWLSAGLGYKGYEVIGTNLSQAKVLTANYYDNYNFLSIPECSELQYVSPGESYGTNDDAVKGLLTGQFVADTDPQSSGLYSAMYYDYRGRIVQTQKTNDLDGKDSEYMRYNFAGSPLKQKLVHTGNGKTQRQYFDFIYDHAGRLMETKHKQGSSGTRITLAKNEYDELGRLHNKINHSDENLNSRSIYNYNVRSWLTSITGPCFTEELYYNHPLNNQNLLFSGNISGMKWKAGSDNVFRGYTFAYDGLSRLESAVYGEGYNLSQNAGQYSVPEIGYDKHGNMTRLKRWGKSSLTEHNLIDDLTFTYNGNQLKRISDAGVVPSHSSAFQFVNRPNDGRENEYGYDSNGNLKTDFNKKIADIQYNYLNLPKSVLFEDGNRIDYVYDAAGTKKKVTYWDAGSSSPTSITDYCGSVIYENGVLDKILTPEGYITKSGSTPVYHYYLRDHLGNNRVVLNQDGTVEQVNHYYPFGGLFADDATQGNSSDQAYLYNGKELDRKYGLDLYDYSARYMDAAIGRFNTMDPMAEKYYSISPYAYCLNNPMRFMDPTGMVYTDYEIDANGYIKRIGEIDNKPDKLYGTNQSNGKREYITVNDKEMLNTLSGESNIQEKSAFATEKIRKSINIVNGKRQVTEEKITPMANGHAAETSSETDAKNIFIHASKTSNVEWALANNKAGNAVVGTLHENAQAPSFSPLGESYSYGNLMYYAHSHTGTDQRIDFTPSSGDIIHARNVIKANSQAKIELYAPWKPGVKFINLK